MSSELESDVRNLARVAPSGGRKNCVIPLTRAIPERIRGGLRSTMHYKNRR